MRVITAEKVPMFTIRLLQLGRPHGQQSGTLSVFAPSPTLGVQPPSSVANHTPAYSSDARTRARPIDLSRAPTLAIEPGTAHQIYVGFGASPARYDTSMLRNYSNS